MARPRGPGRRAAVPPGIPQGEPVDRLRLQHHPMPTLSIRRNPRDPHHHLLQVHLRDGQQPDIDGSSCNPLKKVSSAPRAAPG